MRAPSPPSEPILGHARILARDPLRTLVRWMDEHGSVVRFRVGRREGHVVFAPEAIRRVLSDPDGIYGKDTHGYRTLRLFVGNGLLTSEGPHWVAQRRILQPAFHKQAIANQATAMREVAQRFVGRMRATAAPLRIDDIAMRTTFDIVTRTLLGADLGGSATAVADAIAALQLAANRRITSAITLPFGAPTPEHLRIRFARRRLRRLLGDLVETTEAHAAARRRS
jgi:cytochrome P450